MGRLVLLEFDNNDNAQVFLDELNTNAYRTRVVGVFIIPATLCECIPQTSDSFRGAKFGLFACKQCRKVKPYGGQYLSDLRQSTTRAKDRQLWVSCRFKVEDGKVRVVTDG